MNWYKNISRCIFRKIIRHLLWISWADWNVRSIVSFCKNDGNIRKTCIFLLFHTLRHIWVWTLDIPMSICAFTNSSKIPRILFMLRSRVTKLNAKIAGEEHNKYILVDLQLNRKNRYDRIAIFHIKACKISWIGWRSFTNVESEIIRALMPWGSIFEKFEKEWRNIRLTLKLNTKTTLRLINGILNLKTFFPREK